MVGSRSCVSTPDNTASCAPTHRVPTYVHAPALHQGSLAVLLHRVVLVCSCCVLCARACVCVNAQLHVFPLTLSSLILNTLVTRPKLPAPVCTCARRRAEAHVVLLMLTRPCVVMIPATFRLGGQWARRWWRAIARRSAAPLQKMRPH